jgi:3',5'-nucleoside bisphosphate phosphatase
MIDLHVHSTASDGTFSPTEIVDIALAKKLRAVALTDHDTVSGLNEFIAAVKGRDFLAVPGVEIACTWYGASLHLLGLFIDYKNLALNALLTEIRENRQLRNRRIIDNLNAKGVKLDWADVEAYGDGQVLGRPHIARALIDKGVCRDIQDAFSSFIGRDAPCYTRRYLPMPERAIEILHQAGGIVILAHPFGGDKPPKTLLIRRKIKRLAKMGIDGIEVYYSDYTCRQTERALKIARDFKLLHSGGSDFHGANQPGVELGTGRGNLKVPDFLIESMTKPKQM